MFYYFLIIFIRAIKGGAENAVQEPLGPFFLRMLEDIFRGTFFDDDAAIHKDDMGRHVGSKFHFMGDDDHRRPGFGQIAHDLQHVADQFRVKGRRRFVK